MKQHPFLYVFAVVLLLLYGGYFWSAYTGYRWLGDDNQTASSHGRAGVRSSHFFHK